MSTVDFIQRSLEFTHAALIDARNGTDEQLHFVPEQGSHSIAWCLWHTSRVEDLIMSRVMGEPQVWSEQWAERTGLPFDGFGTNMSDEDAQQVHISDMGALAGYQDAVFERTAQSSPAPATRTSSGRSRRATAARASARRSRCT